MQKISSITATATPDGLFTNGSVASGVSPTILDAAWFNTIQNELVALVLAGGLTLDPKNDAQVLAALKKLFLQRSSPFADIAADGAQAITTALNNLGLGAGSALPVGVPIPWPLSTPPTSYLKCNGAPFNGTTYPGLAKAYPSLVLPDLRGEFIRGWDDGRGVDTARTLMSSQAGAIEAHSHVLSKIWSSSDESTSSVNGAGIPRNIVNVTPARSGVMEQVNSALGLAVGFGAGGSMSSKAAVLSAGGDETRPRNVAFNYIVRAA